MPYDIVLLPGLSVCLCFLFIIGLYVRLFFFFFQAEDGIRDRSPSRGLGDVYKRQADMRPGVGDTLVLDFEWEGQCYFNLLAQGKNYIPIHKKPWKIAENLDIIVPFGYNTVIVKSRQNKKKKPVRDRFEEAFYSD